MTLNPQNAYEVWHGQSPDRDAPHNQFFRAEFHLERKRHCLPKPQLDITAVREAFKAGREGTSYASWRNEHPFVGENSAYLYFHQLGEENRRGLPRFCQQEK
jgi:hypothetical protein